MNSKAFRWAAPAANDASHGCGPVCEQDRQVRRAKTLQRLLDQVSIETLEALNAAGHGADRQWRGIEAHLNACLERPLIHLLNDSLRDHAAAPTGGQRQARLASHLGRVRSAKPEERPGREPRTLAAMVLEVERAEQEKRRPSFEYRSLLRRYLGVAPAIAAR